MKLLAVALTALGSLAMAGTLAAEPAPPSLTVTAEGHIAAIPDMATIRLGVVAEDAEAAEAARQMRERMAAVLSRLGNAGIDARDVQTTGFSVEPRWREAPSSPGRERRREITGFVASSSVTVRVRDLDKLGGILDDVVANGANDFRGLSFGLQEPDPVKDEARKAAVAEAARRAALYAEAAGVGLGPILRIDEQGGVQPRMMRAEMGAFASDAGMPIAAGELEVTASVTITYALGAMR